MKQQWKICSKRHLLDIPIQHIWYYRYLINQLVKKDIQLYYRQTYLGPLWFFIQPVLSTLVFTFVFARLASLSTNQAPPILFYLSGLTVWNYFAECFSKTCTILRDHVPTFSKLYFPRLIIPLSIVIANLVKFGIQLLLFLMVYTMYVFMGYRLRITMAILLVPYLALLMGFLGLGMGLIVSALTVKYRDLAFLVSFGTQLLMFVTPVIYPISSIDSGARYILLLNPIAAIIETFRYAFLSAGEFSTGSLIYSSIFIFIVLCLGLILYHKVERNFIDLI